jgi:hypothetical protein
MSEEKRRSPYLSISIIGIFYLKLGILQAVNFSNVIYFQFPLLEFSI